MTDCNLTISVIQDNENIGESLYKINNNFEALQALACDIEKTLDKDIEIRTFFYYGPNSPTDSGDGMEDGKTSRPSVTTIENFVNTTLQLSLISEDRDVAYVIYQKTGWAQQKDTINKSGSGTISYTATVQKASTRKITISRYVTTWYTATETFYAGYRWSTNINDVYNQYAPVLVIYKLTCKDNKYSMDKDFPKFTRAATNTTANWNNPTTWSIY